MSTPKLTWTLKLDRGDIAFGRTLPVAGNTYELTVEGGVQGDAYTFYVLNDKEVCLAKSSTTSGTTTIAFNTKELRDQFSKDWHEVKVFHCTASNGTATVAESDLSIEWNPLWTDAQTGEAYSLRGPQGVGVSQVIAHNPSHDQSGNALYDICLTDGTSYTITVPRGTHGESTTTNYIVRTDGSTKYYHEVSIALNEYGEYVVSVKQEGTTTPPVADNIPKTDEANTFTENNTFTGQITASGGVVGNVTGNVTGDLTGDVTGDVTGNVTGDITGDVIGDLAGNADTATTLETARALNVQDADGTNTGTAVNFDGSANATIRLPATIKASVTGVASGNALKDLSDMRSNAGADAKDFMAGMGMPGGSRTQCSLSGEYVNFGGGSTVAPKDGWVICKASTSDSGGGGLYLFSGFLEFCDAGKHWAGYVHRVVCPVRKGASVKVDCDNISTSTMTIYFIPCVGSN